VYCWGLNSSGQLGDNSTNSSNYAAQVSSITTAVELAAGNAHTCARLASGTEVCWGSNGSGQIGDGTSGTSRLVPTAVSGLTNVSRIGNGGYYSCAAVGDSAARCWGSDSDGQLGNGSAGDSTTPQPVMSLTCP
jgi:alpha-tubulin suppressor-like RCC1 family protein